MLIGLAKFQEQMLVTHSERWLQQIYHRPALTQSEIGACIRNIYRALQWAEPTVIFCDSPWQMIAMIVMLQLVFASGDETTLQLLSNRLRLPLWSRCLLRLKEQLNLNLSEITSQSVPDKCDWIGFGDIVGNNIWVESLRIIDEQMRPHVETRLFERLRKQLAVRDIHRIAGMSWSAASQPVIASLYAKTWLGNRHLETDAGRFDPPIDLRLGAFETEFLEQIGLDWAAYLNKLPGIIKCAAAVDNKAHDAMLPNRSLINLISKVAFNAIRLLSSHVDGGGQLPLYSFAIEAWGKQFYDAQTNQLIEMLTHFTRNDVPLMLFSNVCFISDWHTVLQTDEADRLHSESGPSVCYADGFSLYARHGVVIPDYIIEHPEQITVNEIEHTSSVEIRRIMIEQYGESRYLLESGALEIHRDEFGVLYRKEILHDEPLTMVAVRNSTPEPDGSFKQYFLRVPPNVQTAHEAIAWTFGQTTRQYKPSSEA